MISVTGASGQLGRAIVDLLIAADIDVIAGTRSPQQVLQRSAT